MPCWVEQFNSALNSMSPVGRGATSQVSAGGNWTVRPAYSYAHSQGLFLGMSLGVRLDDTNIRQCQIL
jgi:lipid-binding SYLF domain-containing protein